MRILRTPEERFQLLAEFPFAPNYREIDSGAGHFLQEDLPEAFTRVVIELVRANPRPH